MDEQIQTNNHPHPQAQQQPKRDKPPQASGQAPKAPTSPQPTKERDISFLIGYPIQGKETEIIGRMQKEKLLIEEKINLTLKPQEIGYINHESFAEIKRLIGNNFPGYAIRIKYEFVG